MSRPKEQQFHNQLAKPNVPIPTQNQSITNSKNHIIKSNLATPNRLPIPEPEQYMSPPTQSVYVTPWTFENWNNYKSKYLNQENNDMTETAKLGPPPTFISATKLPQPSQRQYFPNHEAPQTAINGHQPNQQQIPLQQQVQQSRVQNFDNNYNLINGPPNNFPYHQQKPQHPSFAPSAFSMPPPLSQVNNHTNYQTNGNQITTPNYTNNGPYGNTPTYPVSSAPSYQASTPGYPLPQEQKNQPNKHNTSSNAGFDNLLKDKDELLALKEETIQRLREELEKKAQISNTLQRAIRDYELKLQQQSNQNITQEQFKELSNEQKRQISHLESIIDEKNKIQSSLQQELELMRVSIDAKDEGQMKKMADLEAENRQMKNRITQQQAQYTMLGVETTTYRTQLKEQEKNTEALRIKVRGMKEELNSLEAAYEGTVHREKELEKIVQERIEQTDQLQKENVTVRELLERQKKKIKTLSQSQERLKKQQESIDELRTQLEALQRSEIPKNQTIKSLKESLKIKDEHAMALEQEMATHIHRVGLLESDNQRLKAEIMVLREEFAKKDMQLNDSKKSDIRISELEKQVYSLNRDLKLKTEELKIREKTIQDMEQSQPQQEETLKNQSSMLLHFQKAMLSKEQTINELEAKIEQLEIKIPKYDYAAHIADLDGNLNRHIFELNKLQQALKEKEAQSAQDKSLLIQLQTQLDAIKQGRPVSEQEIAMDSFTRQQIMTLTRELEIKDKSNRELEQTIQEMSPVLAQVENKINFFKSEIQNKDANIVELEKTNAQLTSQIQKMREQFEVFQQRQFNVTNLTAQVVECLKDVTSLKKVVQNQLEGNNPELSLILGTKDDKLEIMDRVTDKNIVEIIGVLRQEVTSIQNSISEHYAENVGTQCVTQ